MSPERSVTYVSGRTLTDSNNESSRASTVSSLQNRLTIFSRSLHIRCIERLELLHRSPCIGSAGLHVDVHRQTDIRMSEDGLNGFIFHPQAIQIGCKPAPERVPAMPSDTCLGECGFNHPKSQLVEVEWPTE